MKRAAVGVAMALLVVVAAAGCGRDGFEDQTARITVDDRTTTYRLDACGLDGSTVFVVGRTDAGATFQAVVGVEPDGATGVPGSTGITVHDDGFEFGAFGGEAWQRREMPGPPPGSVTSAAVRGSRIQVAGTLQVLDDEDRPTDAAGTGRPFALDARCDDTSG